MFRPLPDLVYRAGLIRLGIPGFIAREYVNAQSDVDHPGEGPPSINGLDGMPGHETRRSVRYR